MVVPASIRQSEGKLEIINQLLLPHVSSYIEITSIEEAHEAIKSMKVCKFQQRFAHDRLDVL
jgi:methylthioribose-1-phosphate isomerase